MNGDREQWVDPNQIVSFERNTETGVWEHTDILMRNGYLIRVTETPEQIARLKKAWNREFHLHPISGVIAVRINPKNAEMLTSVIGTVA